MPEVFSLNALDLSIIMGHKEITALLGTMFMTSRMSIFSTSREAPVSASAALKKGP